MKNVFLTIFPILVGEEFEKNIKILDFPNRLLNSENFKERMCIMYLKELYAISYYVLLSLT